MCNPIEYVYIISNAMKILPSRFLPVANKYVNCVRAFLGRRVSNRCRSTTAIGTVYSSVDNFARFLRHLFVPLLHSFVVTISNNQPRDIIFRQLQSNAPSIAKIKLYRIGIQIRGQA